MVVAKKKSVKKKVVADSGLSRSEADAIVNLLDIATEEGFSRVVSEIQRRGVNPTVLVRAWKKIEELSGSSGTVPGVEEFE